MTTFKEEWEKYRMACYGDTLLTQTQDIETRQAFYAGALISLSATSKCSELPELDAVMALDRLFEEAIKGCAQNGVMAMNLRN